MQGVMATPAPRLAPAGTPDGAALRARYDAVRARSLELVRPLSAEDACVQSMPDASPAKWHLAHVTWFFETFVLASNEKPFAAFHPAYRELFNSYYNAVGPQYPRPARGLLTRPPLAEVLAYREAVDARMHAVIARADAATCAVIELGLEHEQQHQELLLMDIKHLFSLNPLAPAYRAPAPVAGGRPPGGPRWRRFTEGLVEVGHGDDGGFHFDNETPRHRAWLAPHLIATRPVTNGEYLAFIEDGGYDTPTLWLADGWRERQTQGWRAPAYWREVDGAWFEFTLGGLEALDLDAPVCHVSHYEADAYAQWAQARLPTEFEWEAAAAGAAVDGNFLESGLLHPRAGGDGDGLAQLYGDVWEWTRSAYLPYPGFQTPAGAIGEYNGKFMSSQMVLRGGCCASPRAHLRATYRNFFYPHQRWAFSGIRLARDDGRGAAVGGLSC
jgi:ergothioneine biosynthesis protein EgtB